jgi:serine O-acetyltransferase
LKLRDYLDADWLRLHEFAGMPAPPRRFSSKFSPRFAPVYLIRVAQRFHQKGHRRLAKSASLLNFVIFGMEVPARLDIGPGLVIPHSVGIILGAARIGDNVTIYQQVTLGAKTADFAYDPAKRPVVCDGAVITAGAKVIGPVRLGRNCLIGANAVVLGDVPDDAMAVGVPATIRQRGASGQDSI